MAYNRTRYYSARPPKNVAPLRAYLAAVASVVRDAGGEFRTSKVANERGLASTAVVAAERAYIGQPVGIAPADYETADRALAEFDAKVAAGPARSDFEADLRTAVARARAAEVTAGLNASMVALLVRSLMESDARKATPVQGSVKVDARKIVELFERAKLGGLKSPKIRLRNEELMFALAGPQSKYSGDIMVSDGKKFGEGKWYGRITPLGEFVPTRLVTPEISAKIVDLASDPAGRASASGLASNWCCFCKAKLTDGGSVDFGYGPGCAKKWGLPYKAARKPRVVEEVA